MRYAILGTTQAHHDDGTPVDLGGARLRALLTALALAPGRLRTNGALIAEVWDTDPPADENGALQALVGRLRRAVGKAAIASGPGGYRLCAEPDDVDLHRFVRLAEEGARALADGDPAKAAARYDDALALWRGPALTDLPDGMASAARAEAQRLDARRGRIAAGLALGDAARTLPALAELCDAHPLDEPLHALRIRALRDTGRPAEALAAYEAIRAEIADRLGADPGPELRALYGELLTPERSEQPQQPKPTKPPKAPVPQRGGRRGGNLRARLTSFVGREADLAVLRTDLAAHRLVTLLGPGGAGKTRLSQEAAESVADAWPDGVWLAELAPVDDPKTVPETVLTALGARETVIRGSAAEGLRAAADPAAHDPLTRLVEHCEPRRMLIVLDNCEHLVEAAARLADSLLARCPGVTVLATSREPLAVPGELVRPVEPLPDPVALRLFQERGAAARPGFRTDDDPAACAEICRRLDGLPLAVELAAARLRLLTPRQIADRLDDRFRLLTSGSRTVLPRQQTLRAVVDWSWDLLDARERTVLARLSVFAGGCDLPAAEAVCGDPGDRTPVDPRDVAALLGSLVDRSLVVAAPGADGADGEMRYRLLETVAEYAAERLDETGERAVVERRHLVAYRELARTADPLLRGREQRVWLARLETEHENLRTALRRAVAAGDEQEALCLVLSLGWFWNLRGHRGDGRHWATAAARLGPNPFAPPVAPAPPLYTSCTAAPPPMEPEMLEEARRGVRLFALANLEGNMKAMDDDETRQEMRGIAAAYRPGLPQNCRVPGVMWFFAVLLTGDLALMREVVDQAVRTSRKLGYSWELAFTLQMRAKVMTQRTGGDPGEQARRDADESLELFIQLGDAWGVAEALSGRGETLELIGDGRAAADDYRAAIRYAEELDAHAQVVLLRARLAGLHVEHGDETEAAEGERVLRELLTESAQADAEAAAYVRMHLAHRYGVTGRVAEARELLAVLHEEFANRALDLFQGLVEGMVAWLDLIDGQPGEALTRIRRALVKTSDLMAQVVAPQVPVVQLMTAARVLAALGGAERAALAARLLGAYDALRPGIQRIPASEREDRAAGEAAVRVWLEDGSYERAYAEGGGLTVQEAAALV
ncbi:ATP-binding protein [Streptomyces sp. NPDC059850]|uniref:ATP-binding protein n=1 Tax=Streptomyces sp. NPDC059850 TaxID=3346970 RepID=UPI003665D244